MTRSSGFLIVVAIVLAGLLIPSPTSAHNVSKQDASFVQSNEGPAIVPFIYLGAKHWLQGI